ncbi:hypothetical protein GCM10027091_32960 [Streptomyces daliensis]
MTGATGHVGSQVVHQLLAAGASVRALVRDPGTAVLPEGAKADGGDLAAPDTLDEALTGADTVFLIWPFLTAEGAPAVLKAIAGRARRLVYVSSSGERENAGRQTDPINQLHADVDTDFWFDSHWILDSTPVECGRSRPTVKRSDMAGWAGYGYRASHSRFFWGLRLYLVCTPTGMPILWTLANPKLDEREVLTAILDREPEMVCDRPGLLVIADKGFTSKEFEAGLPFRGAELPRPLFKREKKRKGESLLKSVRHLIESVNDTLKGQLDLEQHGGRTFEGVAVRVTQHILAMAAAIWHTHKIGQPVIRSLIAYDHRHRNNSSRRPARAAAGRSARRRR